MGLGILKTAAISVINTANPSPEAIAAHTSANSEAHNNQIELASEMITSLTHDNALDIANHPAFDQNSAKNEHNGNGSDKLSDAEFNEVIKKMSSLRDTVANASIEEKSAPQAELDNYRATDPVFLKMKNYYQWAKQKHEKLWNTKIKAPERYYTTKSINDWEQPRMKKNREQREALKVEMKKLQPLIEKRIGLQNMDAVFDDIVDSDSPTAVEGDRPDLEAKFLAGFSPEFLKRYTEMGMEMRITKYSDRLKMYMVYGTDQNGEDMEVSFLYNRHKNLQVYMVERPGFGLVLAGKKSYKGNTSSKEIRANGANNEEWTVNSKGETKYGTARRNTSINTSMAQN